MKYVADHFRFARREEIFAILSEYVARNPRAMCEEMGDQELFKARFPLFLVWTKSKKGEGSRWCLQKAVIVSLIKALSEIRLQRASSHFISARVEKKSRLSMVVYDGDVQILVGAKERLPGLIESAIHCDEGRKYVTREPVGDGTQDQVRIFAVGEAMLYPLAPPVAPVVTNRDVPVVPVGATVDPASAAALVVDDVALPLDS
jgi:hypothetical protein